MNPYIFSAISLVGITSVYYLLLFSVTSDKFYPFNFFADKWFLITPLFLGFALQMYFLQKIRLVIHENSLKMAGASAGVNIGAMVACCAHYLVYIFPFLGLIGFASVMDYQNWFLGAGVLINIGGVIYMMVKLNKHKNMACCITKTVNA